MINLVQHNPQLDQIAKPHYYSPRESFYFVFYPTTELVCFHPSNLSALHVMASQSQARYLLSVMPIDGHYSALPSSYSPSPLPQEALPACHCKVSSLHNNCAATIPKTTVIQFRNWPKQAQARTSHGQGNPIDSLH